ncbi:MAG: two-component regulator propeller domain-containing protein, partial [Syntrophothermus sp.]
DGSSFNNYFRVGTTLLSIVTDITMDSKGNLWISSTSGLTKYNGQIWKTSTVANSGLPTNSVISIAVDKEDNKWLSASSLAKYIGGK